MRKPRKKERKTNGVKKMSEKQLKIINDYYIQYSGDEELFDLHKPSDIRCLIGLLNCALCRQEKTIEALEKESEQLRKKLEQIYSFKGLNCRCVNGV